MKKAILGALIGGFVYFVWSTVWWAVSGIPVQAARQFADEAAVEKFLTEQAKEGPGYYVLPTPRMPGGLAPDAQQKFMNDRMKKIESGFFLAGAVRPGGVGAFGAQIGGSFAMNVVTALVLTLLVLHTGGATFGARFLTVFLALAAGTTGITAMAGVWWGIPANWLGMLIADWMIGWSLAGLAIAKIATPAS